MLHPQTANEYHEMRNFSGVTVVKFTADWCNVCKKIQPQLDNLAREFPNVKFIAYNVEVFEDTDSEDIQKLPTFKIFKDQNLVEAFAGDNVERITSALRLMTSSM